MAPLIQGALLAFLCIHLTAANIDASCGIYSPLPNFGCVANLTCISGLCACPSRWQVFVADECLGLAGSECDAQNGCVAGATCNSTTNTCECMSDHIESAVTGQCLKSVGSPCSNHTECQGPTAEFVCRKDNTCGCRYGEEFRRYIHPGIIPPPVGPLGICEVKLWHRCRVEPPGASNDCGGSGRRRICGSDNRCQCLPRAEFNATSGECECELGTEFLGSSCSCISPAFILPMSEKCGCAANMMMNPVTKRCEDCKLPAILNAAGVCEFPVPSFFPPPG